MDKRLSRKITKSQGKKDILARFSRCIYCEETKELTLEHMPPRGMFRDKQRPSGWEFAACKRCNSGTGASDALAQFFAQVEMTEEHSWKSSNLIKLHRTIDRLAPGVMHEIFDRANWRSIYARQNGLLHPLALGRADGPLTRKMMNIFCAKMAMAAFCAITARPLETDGVIFTEWYLNGGMNGEIYRKIAKILPNFGQIEQGQMKSGPQFFLRYNTDTKGIVASLITFHTGLYVTAIAADDPKLKIALLETAPFPSSRRPTAQITDPGLPSVSGI